MDSNKRQALEQLQTLLNLKNSLENDDSLKDYSPALYEYIDEEIKSTIDYINFSNK